MSTSHPGADGPAGHEEFFPAWSIRTQPSFDDIGSSLAISRLCKAVETKLQIASRLLGYEQDDEWKFPFDAEGAASTILTSVLDSTDDSVEQVPFAPTDQSFAVEPIRQIPGTNLCIFKTEEKNYGFGWTFAYKISHKGDPEYLDTVPSSKRDLDAWKENIKFAEKIAVSIDKAYVQKGNSVSATNGSRFETLVNGVLDELNLASQQPSKTDDLMLAHMGPKFEDPMSALDGDMNAADPDFDIDVESLMDAEKAREMETAGKGQPWTSFDPNARKQWDPMDPSIDLFSLQGQARRYTQSEIQPTCSLYLFNRSHTYPKGGFFNDEPPSTSHPSRRGPASLHGSNGLGALNDHMSPWSLNGKELISVASVSSPTLSAKVDCEKVRSPKDGDEKTELLSHQVPPALRAARSEKAVGRSKTPIAESTDPTSGAGTICKSWAQRVGTKPTDDTASLSRECKNVRLKPKFGNPK